mgnify:CR=1 FL=1
MTAAKSERLLQIYSKLANGEILKKKNWHSTSMSRNGASSVT